MRARAARSRWTAQWNPNSPHPSSPTPRLKPSVRVRISLPSPLPEPPPNPTPTILTGGRFSWRRRRVGDAAPTGSVRIIRHAPPSPDRGRPLGTNFFSPRASALPVRPPLYGGRDQIPVAVNIRDPSPAPPPTAHIDLHPADLAPTRAVCRRRLPLRLSSVPRPRRLQLLAVDSLGPCRSNTPCLLRASGPLPRCSRPLRAAESDESMESKEPTTPMKRWLCHAASAVSQSSPKLHSCLAALFWVIRIPGFEGKVASLGTRLKLPPRVTSCIVCGAFCLSILYDLGMGGKDMQDLSSYLMGFTKKNTTSDDKQQD